jgi:hypothetical protein
VHPLTILSATKHTDVYYDHWKLTILRFDLWNFFALRAIIPLKTEFLLNNTYKFSPYLTGNTLRLHYKAQPVNAVWGNSRCLL